MMSIFNMNIRNHYGRYKWLGKMTVILIIIWLLAITLLINQILKTNSNLFHDKKEQKLKNEDAERMQKLSNNFEKLKKQNVMLHNILIRSQTKAISENNLDITYSNENKDFSTYDLFHQQNFVSNNCNEPSLQYEEMRRQIKNDVREIGYFINGELNKIKKDFNKYDINSEIDFILSYFKDYKISLSKNIENLIEADGFEKWREKEAINLSNLVQQRFRYLQNPLDCHSSKKLVCNINKGCGFGCQVHHLVYCFIVAYGTERTLILKSKGWRYQKEGWESVFKPLSDTCIFANGDTQINWPGDSSKQVISLPIVDNVYPKPIYQPPSIPADIAKRLTKIHGYPLVWWVGQVLKYTMRPNENTRLLLKNKKKAMNFSNPIVGVHIRRTDKVGTEAAFHDIDEYMLKVEQYYDSLKVKPNKKKIFLASDDPKVILAVKRRYSEYEIIADIDIAQTASVSQRYSNLSLKGIIIDIHFLSLCDFLVCTFSSQVCRVAYELMQTHHVDAHDKFTSLDDIYYYGGQNPHPHVTIMNHTPRRYGEIELTVGDEIEVHGNHWDGYSKGKNLKTGATGLFPSFKVKNTIKSVNFPKYGILGTTMDKV
ncbi:alpha-(1,6)-fucosyltransferase isoform X2 [Phymastichus coffea]|uniref:alpha-(1,6)-fucosyltransferase isoform X2 n=1 Tax=Phymastichus coffea TaxID=108790 RepID=UPI00273B8112|nr:alpha-(1,6)-fucosyltransferase isoform X2 [Phymastichus coffea]